MLIVKIAILVILSSCSILPKEKFQKNVILKDKNIIKISYNDKLHFDLIKEDLKWLKRLSKKNSNISPFVHDISNLKNISINNLNCSTRQIACVFPNSPSSIYLKPRFFKMHRIERIGTLIHETIHHKLGYNHFKCKKNVSWGYECDKNLNSPYGQELKFYQNIKDEKYFSEIINATRLVRQRINLIK